MKKCCCHISKQRMLHPSSHQWALRELRMEQDARHLAVSLCSHPPTVYPEEIQDEKHRILAPDRWGERNDFSQPWFLHLPIHRKALNSLTWDVWFSLVYSNLLMFRPPGLFCKNFYISWLLPYLFRTVPKSYLRVCILGLSPQFCPPNKT